MSVHRPYDTGSGYRRALASWQVRIVVALIVLLALAAAIVLILPSVQPDIKTSAYILTSVVGAAAAIVPLIPAIRKGLESIRWANHSDMSDTEILKSLIERHIVLQAEAAGRATISRLDSHYWTNLCVDFGILSHDRDAQSMCSVWVGRRLAKLPRPLLFVEPADLDEMPEERLEIRAVIDAIRQRISRRPFVRAADLYLHPNVVLLAGHFSPHIRVLIQENSDHISKALFLVGPDAEYLFRLFGNFHCDGESFLSCDTLEQVDRGRRRSMLWHR